VSPLHGDNSSVAAKGDRGFVGEPRVELAPIGAFGHHGLGAQTHGLHCDEQEGHKADETQEKKLHKGTDAHGTSLLNKLYCTINIETRK